MSTCDHTDVRTAWLKRAHSSAIRTGVSLRVPVDDVHCVDLEL